MNQFLKKIHINKIFHLENIDINIDENEKKHLILTGKNGSGKTVILNALAEYLQNIKDDKYLSFLSYSENLDIWNKELESRKEHKDEKALFEAENIIRNTKSELQRVYGKIEPEFSDIFEISRKVQTGDFVFAFYEATRKTKVNIPTNPDKPNLDAESNIKDSKVKEFVKFLVDLKIQEALARNEKMEDDANRINDWFFEFDSLLNKIFEDNVELRFNYKNYSFTIIQGNKCFGFNELSDGYSSVIAIIADLILKMQTPGNLTRAYEKEGIVLIDEIENHLHLELQKIIMPFLINIFPKVQFIVTTHSPFVLNSLENCVAYDLEKREPIGNLSEYSYDSLVEGYFEVSNESSLIRLRLNRFKELISKKNRDNAEAYELNELDNEFQKLNALITPQGIIGEYNRLKLKYFED